MINIILVRYRINKIFYESTSQIYPILPIEIDKNHAEKLHKSCNARFTYSK